MILPPIRWLRRIAIAIAVIAALAAPVVFPEETKAIATVIATRIRTLPALSVTAILIEITVGAALVVLAAIWWLWWRLPQRQVARLALQIHDPKARADTEDNFRKTIGQVLGGIAVLAGAVAAYLQFTQQQQTAYQQILTQQQASENSLKASRDLLISNQVAKGFEQLASNKMTMRLGGIYALEGVMNTSEQYRVPVLEALCAFVRDNTRDKPATAIQPLATDVQAALTVIGRRSGEIGIVDLSRANLSGANLRGAGLGRANLSDTDLRDANLRSADLRGANLRGISLSGADLRGANLRGADLGRANLRDTDLRDANLRDANLSDLSVGDKLSGTNGVGIAHLDLGGADLRGAYLSGANLSDANLSEVNLSRAHLREAMDLTQAQLDTACGTDANLPPERTLKPCPDLP
jgi:hypothetical protein